MFTSASVTISFNASSVVIGNKDWTGGDYVGYAGSSWNELAEIFDPTTGRCTSIKCSADEIWASTSEVYTMFDIAGPNVLTIFEPTFGDGDGFDVVHGMTRDTDPGKPGYGGHTWYLCNNYGTACMYEGGVSLASDVDPFNHLGVAVGSWTYTVIPVPAAVWLFGSGLLGIVGVARRKRV